MELVGVERLRGRDIATGVVLGFATGTVCAVLVPRHDKSAATGVSQQILFGSIFTLSSSTIPFVAVLSALTLCVLFVIYRPLLLSSVSPDLAAARGIRVRLIGVLFMLALAIAVGLSSIAIGSILSTALLIGPAAAALRVTTNLRATLVVAALWGVVATWLGITLAYDSYYWFPSSQGLPVSFFIVALVFLGYLLSGVPTRRRQHEFSNLAGCGGGSLMFSSFMVNAWIIGSVVAAVAGVVGFFVVMRGSAFAAHAIPNGAFAGAAGANLIAVNPLIGLGVFSFVAALGIATLSRRGRADAVTALALMMMLALGAAFISQSTEYEPAIFSLLFGEILGVSTSQLWPVIGLGVVCVGAVAFFYRPSADVVDRPGDRGRPRTEAGATGTHLPGDPGLCHHHDGAGRGRVVDLHVDDRTSCGGAVLQRSCTRCHGAVGGARPGHHLGCAGVFVHDELARGILGRIVQRGLVHRGTTLRIVASRPFSIAHARRLARRRTRDGGCVA